MRATQDPLVGGVIDARYEVLRVLGEGGMGIVYHVRHTSLRREFGLKVLRKDLAKDTNLCTRFIREARAAATVDHPGIVQITDFGALPSGQPYFVMELLGGQSLSQLVTETGALPLPRFVGIVEQLVDALEAAHRAQVVHRDLKPDNVQVLTDAAGRDLIKILDFGLARVGGESRITKQGFVFGTPHYMSPEQAQGDSVDHRADIYALGVLMYEMATGQLPFDADSYMGVLTQHIHSAPERPSKVLGSAELGQLEQLILRCMEKRPERRFENLAALRAAWDSVLRKGPGGVEAVPRRWWGLGLPRRPSKTVWHWLKGTGWLWPLLIAPPILAMGTALVWVKLKPRAPSVEQRAQPPPRPPVTEQPTVVSRVRVQAAGPVAKPRPELDSMPSRPRLGRADANPSKIRSAFSRPSKAPGRSVMDPQHRRSTLDRAPTPLAPADSPQSVPTSQIVDPWAASETP
jgi:hypothetical protein